MLTSARFDPNTPWNNLPELPPKADIESPEILRACVSASSELAKANALVKMLPSQEVLVHTLPVQEARRSSEIENIVTTNDELYRAMTSKKNQMTPATKEVLRYREALWEGVSSMRDRPILNAPLFERICSRIRHIEMRVRRSPVTIMDSRAQEVIYTPPAGYENLIRLLTNLEHFINDNGAELQPLVKMAVTHYQFEAIHPFTDGNGRTGRILNILYLMHQGLLDVPILYLSRFFIQNRSEYYRYLREVTENGKWQQWILYMLEAVTQTSKDTARRIEGINTLINNVITKAKGKTKAIEREGFVDLLFKWPYCKISIVENELKCSRITATKYLNEIAALGLLERLKVGREYYYINTSLMELLSE
jgi:Fic family protein